MKLSSYFKSIDRKKFLFTLVIFSFYIFVSYWYFENFLHIRFADEEENIVGGYLLFKGSKLYSDIFIQHQPVAYWISSAVHYITQPNSIYELIRNHRLFIIFWSFLWGLFLTYRFGKFTFFSIAIFELTKIYLFGNLFLAESLVVYPLIYLIASILVNTNKYDLVIFPFVFLLSFLLLAPIWPLLILVLLVFTNRAGIYKTAKLFVPAIIFFGLMFLFTSDPLKYFKNTIYLNLFHYIPHESSGFESNLLKPFISPLMVFSDKRTSSFYPLLAWLSLIFVFATIFIVKNKKYSKSVFLILILGLSNIRYVPPGSLEFSGFHSLPWYALLIYLTIHMMEKYLFKGSGMRLNFAILSTLIISLIASKDELIIKRDKDLDYYVNYSRQFDYGEAIKIMKNSDSTLFQYPDEILLYWQSGVKPFAGYIYFYPWMTDDEIIATSIQKSGDLKMPDFFYTHGGYLLPSIENNYTNLTRDNGSTKLFVSNEIVKNLNDEQIGQLSFLRFSFTE